MSTLSPFQRLKWGFLPVERVVEDEVEAEVTNSDSQDKINSENEETASVLSDSTAVLEYRDEANRPWWKFFDEYEYRQNKKARSQHQWFRWFNESDTPAERKLILKLDIILALYSMMAYWAKYLDQTNLNNAYVSGMRQSIGMVGNDLVHTQAVFTVGNIVFQIPFIWVLYKYPLSYILPVLDLLWSVFTLGIFKVQTTGQLQAMRFFVGLFEASAYLAYQYLFGSWYRVDEIVRRSMVYYIGQYLGVLTSGLLQASIYNSLNNKHGLEGWRWMFLVDAIISIAVGFIGFYSLPGTPDHCYSIWLTDDEIRLARKRLRKNGTAPVNISESLSDKKLWWKTLTSWQIYVVTLWNIFCWNNNNGTSGAYLLWLNSLERFSIGKVNQISAITPALGILWLLLTGFYADLFHSRAQAIWWTQVFNFMGNVILAVWYVPEGAKWFAFMLQYFGWAMAPVLYSWLSDICRHDQRHRAIVLVVSNALAQTTTAFISVLVWKTVEAPRYLKGFTWTAVSALCLSIWTFVVLWFYKRDERRHARENGIVIYNTAKGEYPTTKDKEAALEASEK